MIKINLLPNQEKEKRALEKKIGSVLRAGFSVALSLLVLSVFLFSTGMILSVYLKSAQEESRAQGGKSVGEIGKTENLFRELDSASVKIAKVSGEIPYWGKVLDRISQICPEEIKITNVHVEKEHLKISGFSKTREGFLQFQDGLKGEEFLNLVSPVSNLVSPKDFNFLVEVDLEKSYLDHP